MSHPVVILDACVLVPAALRDVLLRSADAGLFELRLTESILAEVEQAVTRLSGKPEASRRLVEHIQQYFHEQMVSVGEEFGPTIELPDPGDIHVLAAAITSGADTIVTANLRDFPASQLAPFGVQVLHPDQFLCDLFASAPETLVNLILAQAADLTRPPTSVVTVVSRLALTAPAFAQAIGESLGH